MPRHSFDDPLFHFCICADRTAAISEAISFGLRVWVPCRTELILIAATVFKALPEFAGTSWEGIFLVFMSVVS